MMDRGTLNSTSVNHSIADGGIFGPMGNQAPFIQIDFL
jgi:hypothetical protein